MLKDMVVKQSQRYGFDGFHVPFVPRAPRSARRGLHKKKVEDSKICPFELLASLAGKLLQESERSSASSNASETNDQRAVCDDVLKMEQDENRLLKTEFLDQGSCKGNVFSPAITSSDGNCKCILKKLPQVESCSVPEHFSAITNLDHSKKVSSHVKSTISKSRTFGGSFHCKVEDGSPVSGEYEDAFMENGFNRQLGVDGMETGGLGTNNISSLKDSIDLCTKFPASINSDSNVKLPSCRDSVPSASILRLRSASKLGIRDDDENFSRYNKRGTKPRAYRHPSRIGERRLRKLLASKYWNVAPKLKDCDLSKAAYLEGGVKSFYHKRKICYCQERYQHDSLFKRRKFSDHSLVLTSDGGFSSDSVCNSPEKGVSVDKRCSENGASSSNIGRQLSAHSKDSHVKFSIKSFRIPEIFIEVPENATVGSLKRTVMETVTAILGSGLRVGVVLHGKVVRDDNRTLSQSGISSEKNLDTLGFTLEPCTVQALPSVSTEDPPIPISCDTSQLALRSAAASVLNSGNSEALPDPSPLINSVNNVDSNSELLPSTTEKFTEKTLSDSRALVAVPSANVDALAVVPVPVNHKARRSQLVQRRTRRPFSVTEVEALVEAVEELGTGRWRDVKLRSFENANHRTYVDLKDKWKTLVHTAKIAPQQRRGEPVPQELLDRVLAAHAYWSQHQAKQHSKNHAAVLKITERHGCGRNGVEGRSPSGMM